MQRTRPSRFLPLLCAIGCGLVGVTAAAGPPVAMPPPASVNAPVGAEPAPSEPTAITRLPFLGIAPEIQTQLRDSMVGVLKGAGYSVLKPQEVENRLVTESRLLGCSTPSCYSRLAQVLGVRRVIEGEVQRLELSTFAMKLQIRDLFTGKLSAPAVQERCDVCSNDDVKSMVLRGTQTLVQMAPPASPQSMEKTAPTSGILVLESDPQNAEVTIDGTARLERTPASFLLAPGVHDVRLRGAGYRPTHQQVEIPPGQQVPLKLVLSPLPQRRPWLTALSVIGALGTVGLAVGTGVLFALHDQPVITDECPEKPGVMFRCPQKYDNLAAGVGTAVGAGVLLIGTSVAFYFDHAAPRRAQAIDPTAVDPPQPPQAPDPVNPTAPPSEGSASPSAP